METIRVKTCPREQKHQVGTKFSGTLSQLMHNGPRTGQRAFVDVHSCTLTLSLNILMFFADTVVLVHSPNGCHDDSFSVAYLAAKLRNLELQNPFMHELRNIHCCATAFNEKDVIFGGEKKLKLAIMEAWKRYNPKMICVLASCITAIIGDDITSVCEEAQAEIGDAVYILPFNTHGFQSHAWVNYADHVWGVLVERVMKKPEQVDQELINFFRPLNMTSMDVNEMERLVGQIGLRVNVFPDYQSIEALEHASEAALNTGMCKAYHQPLFEYMFAKFKTPFADAPYPLGIKFTKMWLREIGKKMNKEEEVEQLINREMLRIAPELAELRRKLQGKTVVVSANHAKTISFAQACHDLGLTILSAISHSTDNSLQAEYQMLKTEVGDIDFHVGSPTYEEISHLNNVKPDICVSHLELAAVAAHCGFSSKNTYLYNFQDTHFGFNGVITLGKQILRGIMNPLKHKILKYYQNDTGLNWKESPFLTSRHSFKFVNSSNLSSLTNGCEKDVQGNQRVVGES